MQLDKYFISALLFVLLYFVAAIYTLPSYGINWDEMYHYERGQAMLHFLLSGKKEYLPDFQKKTIYHTYDFKELTTKPYLNANHPALGGILGAVSNYVFHQQLGISPDIESYRYIAIFFASVLLLSVFLWTRSIFGLVAGVVATISLALFPLYWAELHYSVKDIPQTVFYTTAIMIFYKTLQSFRAKHVLLLGLFIGLAMSFKYNVFFSVFIFLAWTSYLFIFRKKGKEKQWFASHKTFLYSFLLVPVIALSILVITWPTIWFNPKFLLSSLTYISEIGSTNSPGLNWIVFKYLLFSTPEITLIYLLVGLTGGFFLRDSRQHNAFILVLLWFLVPILRVTVPGANIYGGLRQIMELVPALCILAGIGASIIFTLVNRAFTARIKVLRTGIITVLILGVFLTLPTLMRLHPNEGVYFNSLIGGLQGAKKYNIPGWGNNLGQVYRQGIRWLNEHAEHGAKVVVRRDVWQSSSPEWIRSDIRVDYHYEDKTGPRMRGEYYMYAIHEDMLDDWYLNYYVHTYLEPIYEVKADNVPILAIYKNDSGYSKFKFTADEIYPTQITSRGSILTLDFQQSLVRGFKLYKRSSFCTEDSLEYITFRDPHQEHLTSFPIIYSSESASVTYFIKPITTNQISLYFNNEECLSQIEAVDIHIYEN